MNRQVSYTLFLKKKNKKKVNYFCQRNYFSTKELTVKEIANGVILPAKRDDRGNCTNGGIVANGYFYENSVNYYGSGKAYSFSPDEVVYQNEEVVYIGMWTDVWGHCITDNIKHLWFLLSGGFASLKQMKWVYTASSEINSPNFFSLLEKLGISHDRAERIVSITQFRKIYLPDDCFFYSERQRYYTQEYNRLIDCIISKIPSLDYTSSFPTKVYFTRTGIAQKWQRDTGEDRIEKVFRQLGYAIYYPEQMTFDEQLQVLHNCESFAATEGSVSHNALFLKNGTEFICIRKSDYYNVYQFAINQMKQLSVKLIDSNGTFRLDIPQWGPFFLYNSRQLQKYAKTGFTPFPIFSYLAYLYRFEPRINHLKSRVKRIVVRQHGKKKSLQDCL